jgi:hypothetical protein
MPTKNVASMNKRVSISLNDFIGEYMLGLHLSSLRNMIQQFQRIAREKCYQIIFQRILFS